MKWKSFDPLLFICPACEVNDQIQSNIKSSDCLFCPLDWGELEEFRIYNYMCERKNTLYLQYLKTGDPLIALKIAERQFMSVEEILKKAKIEFKIMEE